MLQLGRDRSVYVINLGLELSSSYFVRIYAMNGAGLEGYRWMRSQRFHMGLVGAACRAAGPAVAGQGDILLPRETEERPLAGPAGQPVQAACLLHSCWLH